MQWSQIKTLFILCFLLLNVYLLVQYVDKQKQADLGLLERADSTIEEKFEQENIKINKLPNLSERDTEETFIAVKQKKFTDSEMKKIDDLDNQLAVLINKTFIISEMNKSIQVPSNASGDEITSLVKRITTQSNEYKYWDWNKERNVLIFFQEKNGRTVYYNQSGLLLVFLNNNNEVDYYTQTMLGDEEPRTEKKKIIKPIKVLDTLYKSSDLNSGEEVIDTVLGYHTRVPLANGVQVFVPTWKVNVNNERDYFVNAIEGFIFSNNEDDFLNDVIDGNLERLSGIDHEDNLKNPVLKRFMTNMENAVQLDRVKQEDVIE